MSLLWREKCTRFLNESTKRSTSNVQSNALNQGVCIGSLHHLIYLSREVGLFTASCSTLLFSSSFQPMVSQLPHHKDSSFICEVMSLLYSFKPCSCLCSQVFSRCRTPAHGIVFDLRTTHHASGELTTASTEMEKTKS